MDIPTDYSNKTSWGKEILTFMLVNSDKDTGHTGLFLLLCALDSHRLPGTQDVGREGDPQSGNADKVSLRHSLPINPFRSNHH